MLQKNLSILSSQGWMNLDDFYFCSIYNGGVDVATIVNNQVSFTKVSKICKKHFLEEMVDFFSLENDEKYVFTVPKTHPIYYEDKSGEIKTTQSKSLCGEECFSIPSSIFIPDDYEIAPHVQDCISTMGLMAILYFYSIEFNNKFTILQIEDEQCLSDLATHAGFLKLSMEELKKNQILLTINPTIYGLSPITIGDNSETLYRSIPHWVFNTHPYAQKEFLKLFLQYLELEKDKNKFPKEHIGKLFTLGIQCGMPLQGYDFTDLKVSENLLLKAKMRKDPSEIDGIECIVEPTNTICVKTLNHAYIVPGGNFENE